jgi:hypothetical protein
MLKLWVDILGWVGSIEVIVAFALINMQKIDSKSVWYQILNLTGAIFLIINTVYYGAYPSTFINLVWVGIAIYGLWKIKN